jgi:hypothetical protein
VAGQVVHSAADKAIDDNVVKATGDKGYFQSPGLKAAFNRFQMQHNASTYSFFGRNFGKRRRIPERGV